MCLSNVVYSFVRKRKRGRRRRSERCGCDEEDDGRERGLVMSFGEYEERVRNERLMAW